MDRRAAKWTSATDNCTFMAMDRLHSPRLAAEFEVQDIRSPLSDVAWRVGSDAPAGNADAFVLVAGTGGVALGESEAAIAAPCVIWLPGDAAAEVRLSAGARGARLRVSGSALGRVVSLGGLPSAFRTVLDRPILGMGVKLDTARRLVADFAEIELETANNLPGGREAAMARLQLVLIALWRLGDSERAEVAASPRLLVQGFLELVELHIRQHWRVGDYARALGITRDRLVSAIERSTGVSPRELIHRRLIEDAEQLLARSSLQVAEVALTLGFKDPGYFNRFFTRRSGISPGRYRARAASERHLVKGSYAAWP